jgi:hypothetical protein
MKNRPKDQFYVRTKKEFIEKEGGERQSLEFDPELQRIAEERREKESIYKIFENGEGFFPLDRAFINFIFDIDGLTSAERDLLFWLVANVNPSNCILRKSIGDIATEMRKPLTKISTSIQRLSSANLLVKFRCKNKSIAIMINPGFIQHWNGSRQHKLENKFNELCNFNNAI